MKKVLVTGSNGFVGKNICSVLQRRADVKLYEIDIDSTPAELHDALLVVEFIFHFAGVNRPEDPREFETGNVDPLKQICSELSELTRTPKIVLSSSIQAEFENPYGHSKRRAEDTLIQFSADSGAECVVYRFSNLFGKWCRPNYNSVAATFCHNIANDLPITISDPEHIMDLTHIDDVIDALISELTTFSPGFRFALPLPIRKITLGELASKIRFYRNIRTTLEFPSFHDAFERALYGTYLTYLDETEFGYDLVKESDPRGTLAEFLKSPYVGQIFISRTKPGKTRGDHYHHTKAEKFLVLQGNAIVRFRSIQPGTLNQKPAATLTLEYRVTGSDFRVVDIPPGYTHSIENIGQDDLVTLFWASEVFNPEKPDTHFLKV